MYASNRYEREPMQVPQNYGGNAFSVPRQEMNESKAYPTQEDAYAPPVEGVQTVSPESEEGKEMPETAQADAAQAVPAQESHEVTAPASLLANGSARAWLSRLGLGQEDLLLLCILLLLKGEREDGSGAGATEDVWWLILLLLVLR